ncbi:hypothetical protein A7M79_01065 [Acinetobacter baumannii]|uniref:hypothetical protein n=1 Tax=Acinetobacter baumannii TaxID=470 RepID=UPI0008DE841E|nr:hypothetical protein [Acinetobacter baumannii]OIH12107.1 hypothetical protein A7M79_01065 [Acinetobacter baumannii]
MQHLEDILMSDQLDNYSDVAKRTKTVGSGHLECLLPHPVNITVELNDVDDIIQAIEQDTQLKKALHGKYEVIFSEPVITDSVKQLIQAYLSIFTESKENIETKQFILRTLNKV